MQERVVLFRCVNCTNVNMYPRLSFLLHQMVSLSLKWMVVERRYMVVGVIRWGKGGIIRPLPVIIGPQPGH